MSKKVERKNENPYISPRLHPGKSLVLSSLKLGKVLVEQGSSKFRAWGTCMYPCVRPGDVLHIEPCTVAQLVVGEIAVCRRPDFLFGHRTISKGAQDDREYIVTRPDRSDGGDDGPTYDENLLGVVVAIERKGRRIDPAWRRYNRLEQIYFDFRLTLLQVGQITRTRLLNMLLLIQHRDFYRDITRLWFQRTHANISYVVQLPILAKKTNDLYHPLSPEEFEVTRPNWQGKPVEEWTLALHLNNNRFPAGRATFVLQSNGSSPTSWKVKDLHVRLRYQGAGFEEKLIDKAEEIISRGNATLHGIILEQ